jgi:hypothetical protein
MSDIEYIASAVPAGNPTTSFTTVIPTVSVGDVLLLDVLNGGSTADPSVNDNDVGGNAWEKLLSATSLIRNASVWWKRATSQSSGKTITASGMTNSSAGVLNVYRNCVGFRPPFQREEGNNHLATVKTRSGIIPTVNKAMICFSIFSAGQNSATAQACTAPGVLEKRSEKISSGGLDCTVSHSSDLKILSGLTGPFTWAQTDALTLTIVYALIPEPPLITFPERLGWRIWYADDSIVTGVDLADWEAAPDTGVVAVLEVFSKGTRTMNRYTRDLHAGDDFYWMVPDFTEYTHKNVAHVLDALEIDSGPARLIPPNASVKEAAIVSDAAFAAIINLASAPIVYGSFPP